MTKNAFHLYIRNHLLFVSCYVKDFFLNGVAGSSLCPLGLRKILYRIYGHRIENVFSHCFIGVGGGKLTMGQGSFINTNCFLDMGSDIVIGKNVSIAMGCSLINSTHKIGPENKRAAEDIKQTIIIEDGVWLGCNVTVLPGLKIGHGSIIAAGSVVIRDCDSNCLYAGVPAKKIRVLSNDLTTQ